LEGEKKLLVYFLKGQFSLYLPILIQKWQFATVYAEIAVIVMCPNYCTMELHTILNALQQQVVYLTYVSSGNLKYYGRVYELIICVAFVRKLIDEMRITISSDPSE
jgi:hypothetical protein